MDNPPENEALDRYLDRLCRLFLVMPELEQAEARDEIRQHILTMIALHEAKGLSEQEAIKVTLEKFGDPGKIGGEMVKAWLKKREATRGDERRIYAEIPSDVIGIYQTGSAIGLGITAALNSMSQHTSWAAVVISAVTCGAVYGLMEAAKTQRSSRQRSILVGKSSSWILEDKTPPENAVRRHQDKRNQDKRNLAEKAQDWLKRNFGKMLAMTPGQKLSPLDLGKLALWLASQGVVCASVLKSSMIAPMMVAVFVYMSTVWLTKEVARRTIYRAHKVR